MANIIWPDDLPQTPLVEGYQEVGPNLVLRTQMDAGVPKVRRRYTAAVRPLKCVLSLTTDELALFETFFTETCEGGADRFEWTHPRTGEPAEFRFTQPPQWVQVAPDLWKVQLTLEVMPT